MISSLYDKQNQYYIYIFFFQTSHADLLATVICRIERAKEKEDIADLERINVNLEAQSMYYIPIVLVINLLFSCSIPIDVYLLFYSLQLPQHKSDWDWTMETGKKSNQLR